MATDCSAPEGGEYPAEEAVAPVRGVAAATHVVYLLRDCLKLRNQTYGAAATHVMAPQHAATLVAASQPQHKTSSRNTCQGTCYGVAVATSVKAQLKNARTLTIALAQTILFGAKFLAHVRRDWARGDICPNLYNGSAIQSLPT